MLAFKYVFIFVTTKLSLRSNSDSTELELMILKLLEETWCPVAGWCERIPVAEKFVRFLRLRAEIPIPSEMHVQRYMYREVSQL